MPLNHSCGCISYTSITVTIILTLPLISATNLMMITLSCLQASFILYFELLVCHSLCGTHSSSKHFQSGMQGVNVLGTTFIQ